MLNTKKVLYILPDLAYIAELLPGKQDHTFVVQAFKQLNGSLIDPDDETLNSASLAKLATKLEAGESYYLVLPDFLFTNTIVEVAKETEKEVIDHIKSVLLPDLGISTETHIVKPFVLTQHSGSYKVQLSALEKSVVAPLSAALKQADVTIESCTPLSWSLKSVVSLEPSITIAQFGSYAFLAEHYIGVDQTHFSSITDVATLAETIKTLKGAEPSIQTVYLISNPLVEEKLATSLSETIPLQQLASQSSDDSELPAHLKKSIEAGMKTLSIKEYAAPQFNLPKASDADILALAEAKETQLDEPSEEKNGTTNTTTDTTDETKEDMSDLPKPSTPPVAPVAEEEETTKTTEESTKTVAAEMKPLDLDDDTSESEPEKVEKAETAEKADEPEEKEKATPEPEQSESKPTPKPAPVAPEEDEEELELAKFIAKNDEDDVAEEVKEKTEEPVKETPAPVAPAKPTPPAPKPPQPKRKQTQGASMLRMLLVFFGVFILTVGVGVGIGFGFIKYSQSKSPQTASPVASSDTGSETTPEPTPEPTPTPEPFDKSSVSVLVVNATTIAGYAGDTQDALEEDGFEDVAVGNAEGEYEPGIYVQINEDNPELVSALEEAIGETLTASDDKTIEDADGEYDAVIVLAE